jgi:hypothetical protein
MTSGDRRTLRFYWRYVPPADSVSAQTEFDPVLHFFVGSIVPAEPRVARARPPLTPSSSVAIVASQLHTEGVFIGAKNNTVMTPEKIKKSWTPQTFTWSGTLKADASLNVDVFAHTYNAKGELCLNEAGSCSLYLAQAHEALHNTNTGNSGGGEKIATTRKTLRVFNADGVEKGSMEFAFFAEEAMANAQKKKVFDELTEYDYVGDLNKARFADVFKKFVAANHAIFTTPNSVPSWSFMRRIHSPLYKFRGMTVPGLCYVLLQSQREATNSVEYYENLLDITLRRHYKSAEKIEQARAEFARLSDDDPRVATVLAELACVFSNSCIYLTDSTHAAPSERVNSAIDPNFSVVSSSIGARVGASTHDSYVGDAEYERIKRTTLKFYGGHDHLEQRTRIERIGLANFNRSSGHSVEATASDLQRSNDASTLKLIESFSVWVRETFTGDCEDFGREILRALWDLRVLPLSGTRASPLLQKLQRMRRRYVPLQTLKGVSSAAITDLDSADAIGAHMDITLVDKRYMMTLMKNFNSSHSMFGSEYQSISTQNTSSSFSTGGSGQFLPTRVCEGTGVLKPDGSPDDGAEAKQWLTDNFEMAFRELKTTLHQDIRNGNSSFYKTIQSALVHEFIADNVPIGEVVFFSKPGVSRRGRIAHASNLDESESESDDVASVLAAGEMIDATHEFFPSTTSSSIGAQVDSTSVHPPKSFDEEMRALIDSNIGARVISGGTHSSVGAVPTYGIRHDALVRGDAESIMAYAMPDATPDELVRFTRVLAHNHPIEALPVPNVTAVRWQAEREQRAVLVLERLKCELRRHASKPNGALLANAHACDWYVRYDQLTPSRVEQLSKLVQKKGGHRLVAFDYYDEPITPGHGSFLLRFWVAKS